MTSRIVFRNSRTWLLHLCTCCLKIEIFIGGLCSLRGPSLILHMAPDAHQTLRQWVPHIAGASWSRAEQLPIRALFGPSLVSQQRSTGQPHGPQRREAKNEIMECDTTPPMPTSGYKVSPKPSVCCRICDKALHGIDRESTKTMILGLVGKADPYLKARTTL